MTVAWSSSINKTRLSPISKIPYDQRSMFQALGGAPKPGAITTLKLYLVNFDVIYSGTEVDAFWGWWTSTLTLGSQ